MPPCLETPCMFGCPPYVWLPPVCLDAAKCMGASKGMRDIQTYGECPNIQGHPNVWGAHGHPLSLTKHVFFVFYMYSRHPNSIQTYKGASKHMGVSKHMGDCPVYMKSLWLNCPCFSTSTISILCLLDNNPYLNIIFKNILINIHQNTHSYVMALVSCLAVEMRRSKHEQMLVSCSHLLWLGRRHMYIQLYGDHVFF